MPHRQSVAPQRGRAPTPGLWIIDAETTQPYRVEAGRRAVVIPPGRTVESLMEEASQLLATAVAILKGKRTGPAGTNDDSPELQRAVALVQKANGMNMAAYEALVDAALALGQG